MSPALQPDSCQGHNLLAATCYVTLNLRQRRVQSVKRHKLICKTVACNFTYCAWHADEEGLKVTAAPAARLYVTPGTGFCVGLALSPRNSQIQCFQ